MRVCETPSKERRDTQPRPATTGLSISTSACRVRGWRLGCDRKTPCYPGFHPLPPRTIREAFAHIPSPTFTTSRSPYAGGFFGAALPGSSHLPWPSLSLTSSALPGSPSGANLSTLQDSLYVAGCGFALLSQEVTTLQHLRSPRSTGCLLRGCLTIAATGLAPTSRRQLFRTHQRHD